MIEALEPVKDNVRLLIDSGAFTAWKAGNTIERTDYAQFITDLPIKPWRYFALDVVGDALKTQNNLEWFFANGFTPTPVFQRGEDFSLLPEYAKHTNLVGIGLGVGSKGSMNYLRETMKHAGDVNVHWLGITRPPWITYYKPYSVDTSAWQSGRRFGTMNVYDKGKFTSWRRTEAITKPPRYVADLIRRYGIDPLVFQKDQSWRGAGSQAHVVTARGWVTYMRDVERRFGTRLFLGCITTEILVQLVDAWKWCEQNETTV
tara:strand:- start:1862 stop:2641 length:780 start_codon:yes stop_codon:yes gene_type:complete